MPHNGEYFKFPYERLSTALVENLTPRDAEMVTISILAERARIKGGGDILAWSEFNENPDQLVNKLLARIIVGQMAIEQLQYREPHDFATLSIESSAVYLASEVNNEITRVLHLSRPPRIIRARKLPNGEHPSPAMSARKLAVDVRPITAGGETRTLVASIPDDDPDLQAVRTIFVVDDFKATRSTLNGGIELAINLFSQFRDPSELTIIPVAGLGKPDQEVYTDTHPTSATVWNVLTALDVRFGPDPNSDGAIIQANGFSPLPMTKASAKDFTKLHST